MKEAISIRFTPDEVMGVLYDIYGIYDVAYPKIKDWADSSEAKQVKSKLSMLDIDFAVARKMRSDGDKK